MGPKKRGRPKKTIQPTIIEAGILPVITKPMGIIGKHVELPGSYWPRRGQSAEELRTLYRCVVRDYTSAHTFQNGKTSAAWQVQEMGVSGNGSLEHGDSSGDILWIPKVEFVPFWWKTHPSEMPQASTGSVRPADVGASTSSVGTHSLEVEQDRCHSAEFPHLGASIPNPPQET